MKEQVKLKVVFLLMLMSSFGNIGRGQLVVQCLDEVLAIEQGMEIGKQQAGVLLLSYEVKATDWNGEEAESKVKVYLNGETVHLFSEEGDLYRDEVEAFMAVHESKLLLRQNSPPLQKIGVGFDQFRKKWLGDCEVVSCEETGNKKRLVLQPRTTEELGLHITEMVYDYDPQEKRLLRIITHYDRNYGLREMVLRFFEVFKPVSYSISGDLSNRLLDSRGQPKGLYAGYTLIDQRDAR